jgi:2-oxo-3-hexenedioate decarboxylase
MIINDKSNGQTELEAIAAEAFAALETGRQITPFSARLSTFDLDDAYRVTATIRQLRQRRGEIPVGRKIGFTNRTIWAEYNIYGPIWGYVYDRTVQDLAGFGETFSLRGLAEPRIEPEIVFKLAVAPAPGMDETALLGCVEWVAHGFEIVQSIFPGWKFSAPDTVAAFGLHGALLIGPHHPIAAHAEAWSRTLSTFEIDLKRDGTIVDHGRARNVLGGPVSALCYLVDILARDQVNPPLAAGELVTTGTLTRALPASAGETWTTELTGVTLGGICVRFA